MIAVGGWNMGSQQFTRMVSSSSSRQEFATSTVKFLRYRKFDGLDLDWEYPANRGSPAGDKQKFGELLKVYINIKCKACVNENGIIYSCISTTQLFTQYSTNLELCMPILSNPGVLNNLKQHRH